MESAEDLFDIVGQKAVVYKYSGGDVEFWIELDADDKKREFYRGMTDDAMGGSDGLPAPAANEVIEGYFVWTRGQSNEPGKEEWTVACRRNVVSEKSSGVRVSSTFVDAVAHQSRKKTRTRGGKISDSAVQVWKGETTTGRRSSTVTSSIPTPVPTDREVCIWTTTERMGVEGEEGFEQHVIRVMCRIVCNREVPRGADTPDP